ncbi:MAG TPA: hypothetical protein PKA53_00605 [Sphingobacterium sp.]|nr:hypothetical protein [Sphingobacterium sp.]
MMERDQKLRTVKVSHTVFIILILLSMYGGYVSAQFTNHGPQIFAATIQGSHFLKDGNGKEYVFTVVRGLPARFVGFEVATGNLVVDSKLTGADGSWDMEVSSDNTVYISGNGRIYSYNLGEMEVKDLGSVLSNQKVVWDLVAGENGKIYGGTYPDCLIFEYDPKHGFREVSQGAMQAGENYVRSLAFDKRKNKIYAGVGSHAGFVELDLDRKLKKQLLSWQYQKHEFVYDMELVQDIKGGDRIFAWINSSHYTGAFVYNLQSEAYEMQLPDMEVKTVLKHPDSDKVYYAARGRVYFIDFSNNKPKPVLIAAIDGIGRASTWDSQGNFNVLTVSNKVCVVNVKDGTTSDKLLEIPKMPISIQTIFWGPDDKVWSAGYLAGQHGTFDPKTGVHTDYPGLHQTEGMNKLGNKLYFGIYAKAYMYAYDVTKPWDLQAANPKYIGQIQGQDRPFAVLPLADRHEVLFGTVPGYGQLGGAITHLDAEADTFETYTDIISGQSIVSLIHYKGKVIGGSSIFGGLGVIPVETRGKIFEWDPVHKRVLWEDAIDDFWSVSGLFIGPDEGLWGFADGTLFNYDVENKKVLYKHTVYSYPEMPSHIWRNGSAVSHPNGLVYFTYNSSMYSFDLKARKVEKLRDNASFVILGENDKIYFRNGVELWSYTPAGY